MYNEGGRMYKARGSDVQRRGSNVQSQGGLMYVDNFMFQQLFYKVMHFVSSPGRRGAAGLIRIKKARMGLISFLP